MGQRFSGSARGKITCRPPLSMAFKFLILALALASSEAARQLRGDSPRDSRSLTNTFPFNANQGEEGHHHHGHHEDSLRASSDIASRDQRQRGGDVPVDFGAVAAARPGQDGKRCIDKVEMVEETEYDDVVQCDHSYDRRCHTTYVTNYESQQEEDCEGNFRKNCFIEYEQIAFNETATVCRTPLVQDCGGGEVRGQHQRLHHQHQVLQVAQGGLLGGQEACEEVHPHHRMHQGAQGALCPCWLWVQGGS